MDLPASIKKAMLKIIDEVVTIGNAADLELHLGDKTEVRDDGEEEEDSEGIDEVRIDDETAVEIEIWIVVVSIGGGVAGLVVAEVRASVEEGSEPDGLIPDLDPVHVPEADV